MDLIERQAAIDTVHRMREIWDTGDVDDLEDMIVTALAELCTEKRTETHVVRLDVIDAWKEDFKEFVHSLDMPWDDYKAIMEYIDDLPSAQPQRTGRWIPCTKNGLPLSEMTYREGQKWYGYKCSNCNFIYKGNALTESPYCKKCGARMVSE